MIDEHDSQTPAAPVGIFRRWLAVVLLVCLASSAVMGAAEERSASEAIRRLGVDTAPWQVDLVLDINCPHCADVFSSTMAELKRHTDTGIVEVVVRWWPRPRDPVASDLIGHVLASANRNEFRLFSSLVVGTPEGRGWLFLRPRLAELLDPPSIEQRLEANRADIERILKADGKIILGWAVQSVPCLILSDRSGAVRGRWEGKRFDVEAAVRMFGGAAIEVGGTK